MSILKFSYHGTSLMQSDFTPKFCYAGQLPSLPSEEDRSGTERTWSTECNFSVKMYCYYVKHSFNPVPSHKKKKKNPANFMFSCLACILFYSAMLVHMYVKYLLKSNWGLRLHRNLHKISFILP